MQGFVFHTEEHHNFFLILPLDSTQDFHGTGGSLTPDLLCFWKESIQLRNSLANLYKNTCGSYAHMWNIGCFTCMFYIYSYHQVDTGVIIF